MSQMEFRGDLSAWHVMLDEVSRLAAQLPDGQRRVAQFRARMDWAARSDDYLTLEPVAVDGVPVMCGVPGPLALAFVGELRDAVAEAKRGVL